MESASDEAQTQLAAFDVRMARTVEMRNFGGLKANEIAAVLGFSPQTMNRDWTVAKSWLAREMLNPESSATPIPATGN